MNTATRVEEGIPLQPGLSDALFAGSSIGGARPKASLRDGKRSLIAKFSATDDRYPVVKGEFVAMRLARLTQRRASMFAGATSWTPVRRSPPSTTRS